MEVVVVGHAEVRSLLPMHECIEIMERTFRSLADGSALQPLRSILWLGERFGGLGLMPGHPGNPDVVGVKVVSVYPGNATTRYESHQGAVMLFETQNGCPLAIVDAGAITAIRTAAVSALATKLLALPDAGDLALLGAGTQAGTHLEAMRNVRNVRRVRVWSRTEAQARRFARRESDRLGIEIEPVAEARDAVHGADLVCTMTAARDPILYGDWLSPGAHVNAVGSCTPKTRELDAKAVARCRLFVDRIESALRESGDFLLAKSEGAVGDGHILGELGDVVLGRVPGRMLATDVTVFESLGLAVEDVAAAHHVFEKARGASHATRVELGGLRDAVS